MMPIQIKVKEQHLFIKWDDKTESLIKLANLRRECPCAVCEAERKEQSDSYIPIYSGEQLHIQSIQTVGNYAIGINWEDNHNTGIYTFDHLKKFDA
jgi:DUF971 family protein